MTSDKSQKEGDKVWLLGEQLFAMGYSLAIDYNSKYKDFTWYVDVDKCDNSMYNVTEFYINYVCVCVYVML